ncbi:hypothetical protein SRHO_G00134370 [Serrasalmus rhombeus]
MVSYQRCVRHQFYTMKGAWLEKAGLDVRDDPSPPPPVQPEKTLELMFDLPSESLDVLFNSHLLGNETPELNGTKEFLVTSEIDRKEGWTCPEVEDMSNVVNGQSRSSTAVEDGTLSQDPNNWILTVPPRVIKKTAKELLKRLETSFNVALPVFLIYQRLVERLKEELQTLFQIEITPVVLDGRLFPYENEAASHIVNEAYKSLLKQRLMKGASCVNQWTIDYIVNTILKEFVDYALGCFNVFSSSPYAAEETSQEMGLPELQEDSDRHDLSDECSEIFTAYQNYRQYGPTKRPCTYLVKSAESPLEGSPDLSNSIPSVQVSEASEDLVENNEDLEIPACADGTEDATTSRKTKKRRLRSRVFNFLRRVICFGCIPSRRVEPL